MVWQPRYGTIQFGAPQLQPEAPSNTSEVFSCAPKWACLATLVLQRWLYRLPREYWWVNDEQRDEGIRQEFYMAGHLERLEKGPTWQPEISKHLLLVLLIISKLILF